MAGALMPTKALGLAWLSSRETLQDEDLGAVYTQIEGPLTMLI